MQITIIITKKEFLFRINNNSRKALAAFISVKGLQLQVWLVKPTTLQTQLD